MDYTTFTAHLNEGAASNAHFVFAIIGGVLLLVFSIIKVIPLGTTKNSTLTKKTKKEKAKTFFSTLLVGSLLILMLSGAIMILNVSHDLRLPTEREQKEIVSNERLQSYKTIQYLDHEGVINAVNASGLATATEDTQDKAHRGIGATFFGSQTLTTSNTSPARADMFAITETATGIIHRQCMVNTTNIHKDAGTVDFRLVCDNNGTQVPLKLKN